MQALYQCKGVSLKQATLLNRDVCYAQVNKVHCLETVARSMDHL